MTFISLWIAVLPIVLQGKPNFAAVELKRIDE